MSVYMDPFTPLMLKLIADEATFQIARVLNRSRADSYMARQRWWRVYAAFPQIYRDAAAKIWQANIIEASRFADTMRPCRPRELLKRLRVPAELS